MVEWLGLSSFTSSGANTEQSKWIHPCDSYFIYKNRNLVVPIRSPSSRKFVVCC
uniref:Uncharacterized protein n=1 Tax=Arundo donax TaxID=35708 RepID=A0A0A8XW01_ARUDO